MCSTMKQWWNMNIYEFSLPFLKVSGGSRAFHELYQPLLYPKTARNRVSVRKRESEVEREEIERGEK